MRRGERARREPRGAALWAAFRAHLLPALASTLPGAASPEASPDGLPCIEPPGVEPCRTAPSAAGAPARVDVVPGLDGWDVLVLGRPAMPYASKREALSAARVAARALAPSAVYAAADGALVLVQRYAGAPPART